MLHISLSNGYWKMYSIVIQLGAILCLPIYFRARIGKLVSTFPRGEPAGGNAVNHPLTLTMIAFVITAVPSWLLTKVIGKHLDNLSLMSCALIVGGVAMWLIDTLFSSSHQQ